MASDNEPAKLLLPYLQRADELQKHEPLVAYYCRLYAMELGLKIPQTERTKTTNSILISLMKQLEKDKKSLQLGPDDHLHLEGFASSVFAKADKQDRAGRADNNTAKTFYAASIFFDILNQFGKVQPDLEQRQKYAVWKAADIRKAIKEGRKPVPGPPGGENDLSQTSSGEFDSEMSRIDPPRRSAAETGPSSESFDKDEPQNFSNFLPSPPSHLPTSPPSHISPSSTPHMPPSNIPPSSTPHMPPSNIPPSPSYPTDEYLSHNFQRQFSNRAENPTHPQSYNHQPYPQDPQQHAPQNYPPHDPHQHLPQNYPPHEPSTYSLPNFQSYPSFSESTLPTAPSNFPPPYYQGSDTSYTTPPPSNATNYAPNGHYNSSGTNGKVPEPAQTPTQAYQYDSNYQPPPEKIAEAHKAARFAVGALAFDDVFIAVDYLKKSLELLTNPSAGQ